MDSTCRSSGRKKTTKYIPTTIQNRTVTAASQRPMRLIHPPAGDVSPLRIRIASTVPVARAASDPTPLVSRPTTARTNVASASGLGGSLALEYWLGVDETGTTFSRMLEQLVDRRAVVVDLERPLLRRHVL